MAFWVGCYLKQSSGFGRHCGNFKLFRGHLAKPFKTANFNLSFKLLFAKFFEVFIISGTLSIGTPDQEQRVLEPGTYAVRPADVPHGPFFTRDGCVMLEFLYYAPS